MERYVTWLKSNGVIFNSIEWPCEVKGGSRGAICTKDVSPTEPFLTVPSTLIIDPIYCRNTLDVGEFLSSHKIFLESEENTLAFYLCHERLKGKDSFWEPYIDMLPKNTESLAFHWSKEELEELQDENLLQETTRTIPVYRTAIYNIIIGILSKVSKTIPFTEITNEETFTLELFCWACEIIISRSFGRRLFHITLVPLADNLNHGNVQTKYHLIDGKFQLFPTGNNFVKKGEEALNSYGRRSNANLLLAYGFALPDNEWDEVSIELTLPEAIPLREKKKKLFPNNRIYIVFKLNIIPLSLLQFFRVVVSVQKELDYANKNFNATDFSHFAFISLTNERSALRTCIHEVESILTSFPTTREKDMKILNDINSTSNSKLHYALYYRIGRKKCLEFTLSFLLKMKGVIEKLLIDEVPFEEAAKTYQIALSAYTLK